MRLHRLISIFALLAIGTGVYAQTPVPTAHPAALGVGLYQFEDLSSPEVELTGAGWLVQSNIATGLRNSQNGNTMTFHVDEHADYMLIYREKRPATSTWQICVDAVCTNVNDFGYSTASIEPVPIQLYETNSQIVITKTNGGISIYDYMTIVQSEVIPSEGTGTGTAESTPEPYAVYGSVEGESGTVETRFDYLVTAGDVAIVSLLLVFFFSVVAAFLIMITGGDNV